MAILNQFEGTVTELMQLKCFDSCELDHESGILEVEYCGDRDCGYSEYSTKVIEIDSEEFTSFLEEAIDPLDLDEINSDAIDEAINDILKYDNDYSFEDYEVIYQRADGLFEITEQTIEEFELAGHELSGNDSVVFGESQWYRGWCFTATIQLPKNRTRGQIHTDLEFEITDFGDAHPAGCGLDTYTFVSEATMKNILEKAVRMKLEAIIKECNDNLDLSLSLA